MSSTKALLHYGAHTYEIDGRAHAEVSTAIVQAHGSGGGWVEVLSEHGALSVFITPGVPIVLTAPEEVGIGVW